MFHVARGKPVWFLDHARAGMAAENPEIDAWDVCDALEHPDRVEGSDRRTAFQRRGRRTVIVRYEENEDEIFVVSVSATRGRPRA